LHRYGLGIPHPEHNSGGNNSGQQFCRQTILKEEFNTMKFDWKLAAVVCVVSTFSPLWAEDEPMKVSRADAMSAATTKPSPAYPAIAKQLKVEGEVQVQVLIGEEGKVEGATALAGNPILTKAAVDTVKEWRFAPFKSNGKNVKAQTVLSFVFKM
jgi:TonB family protein